jgi:hypothetical protein
MIPQSLLCGEKSSEALGGLLGHRTNVGFLLGKIEVIGEALGCPLGLVLG